MRAKPLIPGIILGLSYVIFMGLVIHSGLKDQAYYDKFDNLPTVTEPVDSNYLKLQERVHDIKLQLAEEELDTDELILSDIEQAHLRGLKHPHDALRCLTSNIYFEAGNQPYAGKVAVAQVTMNRVADSFGGNDVCSVVYFKKYDPNNGKLQAAFSWTLGKAWRARGRIDWAVWRKCEEIARNVLAGKLHSKLIGPDVEFYHADYMTPGWVDYHKFVAQIGDQKFYE